MLYQNISHLTLLKNTISSVRIASHIIFIIINYNKNIHKIVCAIIDIISYSKYSVTVQSVFARSFGFSAPKLEYRRPRSTLDPTHRCCC